jgi:ribonuclease HII
VTAGRTVALPLFSGARLAGVDEAGRGPLAGPVVAAAVVLPDGLAPAGLADSKTVAPRARERLAEEIRRAALSWAVAWADPSEIDRLNILQASLLAMQRAVLGLGVSPEHVQVDGNRCPRLGHGLRCTVEAIVRGDGTVPAISAASILAKVERDRMMGQMDARYPGYDFATHKGYPTAAHVEALERLGPSPIHRRSFRPVARLREGAR